jgi:nitroimidazol reductase NimA-like FMN-containing flavoprotein (pyridoxamine 5'-phosphate oxidase superfamily)
METPTAPNVEELSVSECWALLRDVPIGRLALLGGDEIEIFPMNYLVDGGTVVFRTAHGTKLKLIGSGAPCTFEVDEIDVAEGIVWSVVLKGVAKPLRGHEEITASFDMEVPTWQAGPKPTYVRMTPHAVSGRRFPITPA